MTAACFMHSPRSQPCPPLHRMLVERCSEVLGSEDAEPTDDAAVPCGPYL